MSNVALTIRPMSVVATLSGGTLSVVVQTGQTAPVVSGVTSFNGRPGAVVPASGDYTADQITPSLTRDFVTPAEKMAIGTALQQDHADAHPVPTNRDTRNEAVGVAASDVFNHNTATAVHGANAPDRVALLSELPAAVTAADIRAAAGSLPVVALGTLSGVTAIDWGGEGQVVTATVDGVAYEFTKGTGWPATGSADVRLHLTVVAPAAGTWTIASEVANWPASFDAGKHILVISCLNDVITVVYSVKTEAP